MAQQVFTDLDFNGVTKIKNLPQAVDPQDAVNLAQLEAAVAGGPGGGGVQILSGNYVGLLEPIVGTNRFYFHKTATISQVYFSLASASSVGQVQIDVKKNGLSIFPALKPIASVGSLLSTKVSVTTPVVIDDAISVDIIEAGSGARDLVIYIVYS